MSLTAKAYAKINLYLEVLEKRPDGYHEVETVMQSVDLFDEVTAELTDGEISVICDKEELSGEENIVHKACRYFFDFCGKNLGASVFIKKNIPVAAGLGGGSADAAATILLLNKLTNANYTVNELLPLALRLGADVPFCLIGGTALGEGIGEVLTPLESKTFYFVLLKEAEKQSTGVMYQILDGETFKSDCDINELIKGLREGEKALINENIFNSFEFCWDFEEISKPFTPFAPDKVFLSGSGPTVCALFYDSTDALACAEKLRNDGFNAYFVKSMPEGISFE